MKDGKMKGQAFVSFPNEKSAEKALKETNRYILFEKPLVVVSLFLHIYCTELKISPVVRNTQEISYKIHGNP